MTDRDRMIAALDRTDPRWTVGEEGTDAFGVDAAAEARVERLLAPPPKLLPAQDGYVWCHQCDSVQPATGHQCAALAEAEALCGTPQAHHAGCPVFRGGTCECKPG